MTSPPSALTAHGNPALVLDTNTVLALWHFADPSLAPLAQLIESGRARLYARADALDELRSVLAYRQFAIPADRQIALHTAYSARCVLAPIPPESTPLPTCRDPDDQKFLEIARDVEADWLLTRDKLLLKLARHRLIRSAFAIVTPDAFSKALKPRD